MPNIICPAVITCPGFDSPIENFSSEAPDVINFLGVGYPIFNTNNPLGSHFRDPIGPTYTALGCISTCTSNVSQDDADACAAIQAYLCQQAGRQPKTDAPEFYNTQQSCSFPCPDGTDFTWTVLAGSVLTGNQDLSNRIAAEIACERAAQRHLCLPSLNGGCANEDFSQTITILTGVAPLVYTITAGALPPGVTMVQTDSRTVVISGTPTAAGSFPFTLTVQDPAGNYISKSYVFQVIAISPATLPDANKGTAYNQTLSGVGGVGPYTFALELGDLPDGLTLAPNGSITGTPTANGTFDFTVSISDSGTGFCTKDYSILVKSACFDWTTLPWGFSFGGAVIIQNGDGVATFTPNNTAGNIFNAHVSATSPFNDVNGAATENDAQIIYHGGACNCNLRVNLSAFTAVTCVLLTNFFGHVEIRLNGVPTVVQQFCAGGITDIPFSLPDSTVTPTTIYVLVAMQTKDQAVGNVNVTVQGTFTNV